jgi:Asp-tRNA(Asn)/Glu-tRNA(Gln) amidotransferase A subunit family amidase
MAEMTAQEAAEWGKTLDFPTVWAALLRLGEKVDKTTENINRVDERVDRMMASTTENINRVDRMVASTTEHINKVDERVDRMMANTTANLDRLGERIDLVTANLDRLGERIDLLTANTTANLDRLGERVSRVTANVGGLNLSMGELVETLFAPHLGEKFDAYNYNLRRTFARVPIYDDTNRLRGEIDILLSNTTVCMASEVKRWLDKMAHVDEHIRRMRLIRQYPPAETRGKKLLGAMAAAVVDPDVREYAERSGFFILELTGEDVRLLQPPEGFMPKEW